MTPYILLGLSLLANIVQYIIKRRDDEAKELRDRRFHIYGEYFAKLDNVNAQLYAAQTSDEVLQEVRSLMDFAALHPNEKQTLLQKYAALMQRLTATLIDWMKEQATLIDEISKLRLVASPQVVAVLDQYVESVRSQVQASVTMAIQTSVLPPGQFDPEVMKEYTTTLNALNKMRTDLLTLMRRDVGTRDK